MASRASAAAHAFGFLDPTVSTDSALAAVLDETPPAIGSEDGKQLRRYLLSEYKVARLTAEQVCTLAWFGTRAGAKGVADLAMAPHRRDQARHLDRVLEVRSKDSFYMVQLPMWDKKKQQRYLEDFPMALPHEAFPREFALDPDAYDPVIGQEKGRLSDSFFKHEVYLQKQAKACPVGYFSDAVPHTNRDSFIAFYWSSIISGKRHLICSLRKQDLCQCGCKGYCTLHLVMRVIAWSFNCLASGIWPEVRHDGQQHLSPDTDRYQLAGTFLADGRCGAMVEMRADLLEIVSALGFAIPWTPGTVPHPCFLCDCAQKELFNFPLTIEAGDDLFVLRDTAEYNARVKEAVLVRNIETPELLEKVVSALHFDARKKSAGGAGPGLVLQSAIEELGLPKFTRLMSDDGQLQDIGKYKELRAPCTLSFFDVRGSHGLTFVSPLFDIIGFNIEAIHLDVMHVMDLGVTQYLVGAVLQELIENNFVESAARHVDMRRWMNLKAIRRRLSKYYRKHPGGRNEMSEIGRLTFEMLGPVGKPRLRSKAAECRHLVPLMVQLCTENPGVLSAHLQICCRELDIFYRTMEDEPDRHLTPAACQRLETSMIRFLLNWKAYGGHMVFKHHAAWHLVQRARQHGNPRFYWTYADEGENRAMATVAKRLHGGSNFYLRFLQRVLAEIA